MACLLGTWTHTAGRVLAAACWVPAWVKGSAVSGDNKVKAAHTEGWPRGHGACLQGKGQVEAHLAWLVATRREPGEGDGGQRPRSGCQPARRRRVRVADLGDLAHGQEGGYGEVPGSGPDSGQTLSLGWLERSPSARREPQTGPEGPSLPKDSGNPRIPGSF